MPDKISTLHPRTNPELAKALETKATKGIIGKQVEWIKQPRNEAGRFGVRCLVAVETALLSLSLVGLIAVFKANNIAKQLDEYKKIKSDTKIPSPPEKKPIELKSDTQSFNHINDYAINDGKIWFRPHNDLNADWELMYFDQLNKDAPPEQIKADGANLMVKDSNGIIHYKKVMEEWRDRKDNYHYKEQSGDNNWYDKWFSFPVFCLFYHLNHSKQLKLPDDTLSWAMSHRGIYNKYMEDMDKRKHPEFMMVTTVYALLNSGKIVYADPYLPGGFKRTIDPPHPQFKGTSIDASASTILLKGTLNGETRLYTRYADFDSMGHNPFLPGFWNKHKAPSQEWKLEAPLPAGAKLTDKISIFQDGHGNSAREMRVEATDPNGVHGFYHKHIDEEEWKFVSH